VTVQRDSLSPDPSSWTIHPPKSGSNQVLKIELHESLDYILLKNAVRIVDRKGEIVEGTNITIAEETILQFSPFEKWKSGDYTIAVEPRLEDLAGNNLDRLFDNDITRDSSNRHEKIYRISFRVR